MKEQRGGKEGLSKRLWNEGQNWGRKLASCCCGGNRQRDMAQCVPRSQALWERNPHHHKKELQSQVCLGVPGVSKDRQIYWLQDFSEPLTQA